MNKITYVSTNTLHPSFVHIANGFVSSRRNMNNDLYVLFFLKVVLFSSKLFNRVVLAETTQISGNDIIKDCNGILYRLMVDFGEPPFPETACDIKQVRNTHNSQEVCLIFILLGLKMV